MGGVDAFDSALGKLGAATINRRKEGLDEVRSLVRSAESSEELIGIEDGVWQKVLNALFALVETDLSELATGSASAKNRSLSRLETTTPALGIIAIACVDSVRPKVIWSVLNHIIASLPTGTPGDSNFPEVVRSEYSRLFRRILMVEHVGEHIRPKDWARYVTFVIRALSDYLVESYGDDTRSNSASLSTSLSTSLKTNLAYRIDQSAGSRGGRTQAPQYLEDLVESLALLTSITNCPLISKLEDVAQVSLDIMGTTIQAKEHAFSCLNNVLHLAQTEATELAAGIAGQVLPYIRQNWSDKADDKAALLREQILTTMLLIKPYINPQTADPEIVENHAVELMVSDLVDRYEVRSSHTTLRLSDVVFSRSTEDTFFMRRGVSPDLASRSAVVNWALVSLLAMLRSPPQYNSQANAISEDQTHQRKRQRVSTVFPDLIRPLVLDESMITFGEAQDFLTRHTTSLTDDRAAMSSWVLLGIARLCKTVIAQRRELKHLWLQAWAAASRLVTSSNNSRAACFTMMSLLDSGLVETSLSIPGLIDDCFHSGTRGPTNFSDGALLLLSSAMRSRCLKTDKQVQDFREKGLSWLDVVWQLPVSKEGANVASVASMRRLIPLLNCLNAMASIHLDVTENVRARTKNAILESCLRQIDAASFVGFLSAGQDATMTKSRSSPSVGQSSLLMHAFNRNMLLSLNHFLQDKLGDLTASFKNIGDPSQLNGSATSTQGSRVGSSSEMVDALATACIACVPFATSAEDQSFQQQIREAWQSVTEAVHELRHNNDAYQSLFVSLSDKFLDMPKPATGYKISPLFGELAHSLWNEGRRYKQLLFEQDDMELDIDTTQSTSAVRQSLQVSLHVPRSSQSLDIDRPALFVQAMTVLFIEANTYGKDNTSTASTILVNHWVSLPPQEFLSVRNYVLDYLKDNTTFDTTAATKLLHRVAEVCLQTRENERNETALCFCLRALHETLPLWIIAEDEDLVSVASDIYIWFVDAALNAAIASPGVIYELSVFLSSLLDHNPRYGTEGQDPLQSPRTSLLKILKSGPALLKYRVIPSIAKVFQGYVLTEHAAIFDDIVDCLPTEANDKEGIAVRLYALATIGKTWKTVLRQAAYHVFETAANVPAANIFAYKSFDIMASDLGTDCQPSTILRLFGPQIFYTWLGASEINTIPYSAFGFESLEQLVRFEMEELVAQAVLRQSAAHFQSLEDLTGVQWSEYVSSHFTKCMTYAIVTDVVEHRAGAQPGPIEGALRERLGTKFNELSENHFVEILAEVFIMLSDDRGFEKVLKATGRHQSAATIYANMLKLSSSRTIYPARQQPSLRAKYLLQIVAKICRAANHDPDTIWTAALLIYTYRKLLSDANDSLGPLHVAAGVRKLRMVIALAGPTALKGHPLDMLLHHLRPYLTNFHCAEDSIGIYWYLLRDGAHYLEKRLPFVAGLSVAIFTALSTFVKSSQESTTQEVQYLSTMSKARDFRYWLGEFLLGIATEHDLSNIHRFHDIISNAKEISNSGTNNVMESEGKLLQLVLLDQASEKPLLARTFFNTAIQMLSHGFRHHANYADDILADEDYCVDVSAVLYELLRRQVLPKPFQIWMGNAMGRAYAIEGPDLETNRGPLSHDASSACSSSMTVSQSRSNIIAVLAEGIWDEVPGTAGMTESALAYILTAMPSEERSSIISQRAEWLPLSDLVYHKFSPPRLSLRISNDIEVEDWESFTSSVDAQTWISKVAHVLVSDFIFDDVTHELRVVLKECPKIAEKLLPMLVHLALHAEAEKRQHDAKQFLERVFRVAMYSDTGHSISLKRSVLNAILYLRRCVYPGETTFARRNTWLDIDYEQAAMVALDCDMANAALLFLEIANTEQIMQISRSRRASSKVSSINNKLLAQTFRSVSDPDFFYGCHEGQDIHSILARLRHENDGKKVLAMQSAIFDSDLRSGSSEAISTSSTGGLVSALSLANLDGLSFSIQQHSGAHLDRESSQNFDNSVLNIHQWDTIPNEDDLPGRLAIRNVLLQLQSATDRETIRNIFDEGFHVSVVSIPKTSSTVASHSKNFGVLAALAGMSRLALSASQSDFDEARSQILQPRKWQTQSRFEDVEVLCIATESIASALRRNEKMTTILDVTSETYVLHEINAVRASISIAKAHEAAQFRLNRVMYLSQLEQVAQAYNLKTNNAVMFDLADTLWSQGEVSEPIQMLKTMKDMPTLGSGDISVDSAELLTDLGKKLSDARLDRLEEIADHYLQPAIDALQKNTSGSLPGKVFHNYAAFCDQQLQDAAGKDDFDRIKTIRDRKYNEVEDLANLTKKATGKERDQLKHHYSKAKTWLKLDDEEFKRLKRARQQLLQNSLENYLLSMQACDDYAKDVLRFLSLWLGNSDLDQVNVSARKYLQLVPSLKFAQFVNQLSSRLLDAEDSFSRTLFDLLHRICRDHPFHGLYQVFAVSKTKGAQNDTIAESRHKAATKLTNKIHHAGGQSSAIWVSIHNSNVAFSAFAQEKQEKETKTGTKIPLRQFKAGSKLERTIQGLSRKIPPPTMHVQIRADKDYSAVPTYSTFEPDVSIAGGISAPKITTVIATDGSRHKMLLKGGNDDLRQDAIMEQVFAQVSDLLQDHRPTRQRRLGIRTYKVIPLSHNSGIIEFVQNTMPLHDYLLPAHTRYFPKDYRPNQCRRLVSDAHTKKLEDRIKAYKIAVQNFHPVMRFFFMENFMDPDEWFNKRLAYSRSTAAISMLGYVLGVGDRHGHNILLDQRTGEVVHIDLGVAFESGRVLPIPEVVPFRLTRDIVDGMGISGVEGPFRRCCNFTLEALRKNEDAIMTVLDVLRWDPLHSWSVSPLRIARMQEQQEREAAANASSRDDKSTPGPEDADVVAKNAEGIKTTGNEPGEADRALAVVAKKLSASLSVEATVNELIRQATDERNLAVLFCGWAAYV